MSPHFHRELLNTTAFPRKILKGLGLEMDGLVQSFKLEAMHHIYILQALFLLKDKIFINCYQEKFKSQF